MTLPVTGADPHHAGGVAKTDIDDSPYAGMAVSLALTARNLAGIAGSAAPVIVTLPPPNLHDKTALALADLRQQLALAPQHPQAAANALGKLAQQPLSKIAASADLQMAALAGALNSGQINAGNAQQLLGSISQQIDAGPDYQPKRAFAAAAQALEQALQQAANSGKPIDPGQLQKLLAAMQSALSQHMQAMGSKSSGMSASGPMNPGDLNRLAVQIAQDQAAGQSAKAQAELHKLEQILSALQSAKPMSAADAARATAANQAAHDLAKITQAESALLDQTNQGAASPGSQASLRNQLSATSAQLGKAGISLPGLGAADSGMAAAQTALTQQNEENASQAETSAIKGLQKAAAALSAARQNFSFDAGQTGSASDQFENGNTGNPDESRVPEVLPSGGNPASAVQRQIIKNDTDPSLPSAVHQYYQKLLNPDQ